MDKTINVVDFIKKYNSIASAKLRENYFNETVKSVDFVNFEELEYIADRLIDKSYIVKDGALEIDSCRKYLLYIFTVIDVFTNIEIHADKWIGEYNALDYNNLVEKIINVVPKKVKTNFDTILKMKEEDVVFNCNSLPNYFSGLIKIITPIIQDGILNALDNEIEKAKNMKEV